MNNEQVTINNVQRDQRAESNDRRTMRNEELGRRNGKNVMKNWGWIALSLFIVHFSLLIVSCGNGVDHSRDGDVLRAGYGRVGVDVNGADALNSRARTVFPAMAFARYEYSFAKVTDGAAGDWQVEVPDGNGYFTLELGDWTAKVAAFANADDDVPVATGTSNMFTVVSTTMQVPVKLAANVDVGSAGTFSYHIKYPAGAVVSAFTLKNLLDDQAQDIDLTPISGVVDPDDSSVFILEGTYDQNVPAGLYFLTILLEENLLAAGANEVVYIYNKLDSAYGTEIKPIVFSGTNFSAHLEKIEITKKLDKRLYLTGEALELDGLEVTATYSDGTQVPVTITAANISGFDSLTVRKMDITVTYGGKTAVLPVGVVTELTAVIDISDTTVFPAIGDLAAGFNDLIDEGYNTVRFAGTRDPWNSTLDLNIPTGKTVEWEATISGTYANNPLIRTQGDGDINVNGSISASGNTVAIAHNSTGTVDVSGGTITSAATGNNGTIVNNNTGKVFITGGTVSNTSTGNTIRNVSTGTITVSGGTVENTSTGAAIHNNSTGPVNVSGGTVTAATTATGTGTIVNAAGGTITVTGNGKVRNTATAGSDGSNNRRAIQNSATGNVNVSGTGLVELAEPGTIVSAIRPANRVSVEEQGVVNPHPSDNIDLSAFATIAEIQIAITNAIGEFDSITISGTYPGTWDTTLTLNIPTGKKIEWKGTINGTISTAGSPLIDATGPGNLNVSEGVITATGNSTPAIRNNNASGIVTISGSAEVIGGGTGSNAVVVNNAGGMVTVSGGTVRNTGTGRGIHNNAAGPVNVSGGTVSATADAAIYNNSTGTVTVSGGTVTSDVNSATTGTIHNQAGGTITVSGGTVRNNGSGNDRRAIHNQTTGAINVSGSGRVEVTNPGSIRLAIRSPVSAAITIGAAPALVAPWNRIGYTVTQVGGSASAGTTALTLTFDEAIAGLAVGDITVTGGTGTTVTKGTLSGTGLTATWTLNISGIVANAASVSINVSINKPAIVTEAKPVTVYRSYLTGAVTISNTSPRVGDNLIASIGSSNANGGTATWQWQAGGANVGTNSTSYTVAAGDLGKTITAQMSYSNLSGTRTSAATSAVASAKTVTGLTLITSSVKLIYNQNEALSLSGLVVTASYSDGTSANVTGWTSNPASGAAQGTTGTRTVTITYTEGGVSVSNYFTIFVNPPATVGLAYVEVNSMIYVSGVGNWTPTSVLVIPDTYNSANAYNGTAAWNGRPVQGIRDRAFSGQTAITTVVIPASITNVGTYNDGGDGVDSPFLGCTNLRTITINSNWTGGFWSDVFPATNLNVTFNATTVGGFRNCTRLISLTINSAVTNFTNYAFSGCTGLTGSLTIPASATDISQYAFSNCTNLTITFAPGSQLQTIGVYAFQGSRFTSLTLPKTLTSLGASAFASNANLTQVTFEGNTIGTNNAGWVQSAANAFDGTGVNIANSLWTKYTGASGGAGTYSKTGSGASTVWTKQ